MPNLFRYLVAATLLLPAAGIAQTFPVPVPTTRILAIGRIVSPLTPEQRKTFMPQEVPDTLRLILAGKIDQGWVRQDGKGVVFMMNVTTVEEARALLDKLPLGQAKLMEFDLIPLGPLSPLRILLNNSVSPEPAKP